MYQRIGAAALKKDLTNTLALCKQLQNPERAFKSIHIAGTNGKGSVAHVLSSFLQEAGCKVGLYTSPHYQGFRERIRINGKKISEIEVCQFVEEHYSSFEEIKPSFFEITVAMAFDHFRNHQVDFAVVETGLGGRLDSTNVLNPELSIITNISFDHMAMLGDDLVSIAVEKAGIIKNEIPVIIGKRQEATDHVFLQKAKEEGAEIYWAEDIGRLSEKQMNISGTSTQWQYEETELEIETPFHTEYQIENLRTALAAYFLLDGKKIVPSKTDFEKALKQLQNRGYMGRFQTIGKEPLVIVDAAHNETGISQLVTHINGTNFQQLRIVLGAVNDKSLDGILSKLPSTARYFFCRPNIPRGLAESELAELAKGFGLNGTTYDSVKSAFVSSKETANEKDLVLVTGSTFVVAEVLQFAQVTFPKLQD